MIGVHRSEGAPEILLHGTASDRYRSNEVVERLIADFNGKCYICEIAPLQSPEVEHLRPHKGGLYPERLFDWNNLFLSCRHCNSVKAKRKYDEGIIDCCRRDPEILLDQLLEENRVRVNLLDDGDCEASITAELIEEVFMSDNPPLRGHASDVRLKELQKTMNLLYSSLEQYRRDPANKIANRTLHLLLKPEAAFAGFTRCYVRKHIKDYPGLLKYI